MSRDKYSTRLRLVLYLSLDTPPRALFFIQTRGGALTYTYNIGGTIMLKIFHNNNMGYAVEKNCKNIVKFAFDFIMYNNKYVTGFAKTRQNSARTETQFCARHESHTPVLSTNTIDRATYRYSRVCFYWHYLCDLVNP